MLLLLLLPRLGLDQGSGRLVGGALLSSVMWVGAECQVRGWLAGRCYPLISQAMGRHRVGVGVVQG